MSMYRQLWLALVISTLLAAIGALVVSTYSTRLYLQEQLAAKNADTAASLALSLSNQNADAVAIELAVSAIFDNGHYQLVRVADMSAKPIAERSAATWKSEAPDWFIRLIPMDVPSGSANVMNGWKQSGVVTIVSHIRFAYDALWSAATRMVIALSLAGLLAAWLGTLILRRIKAPLNGVIEQARAITERRFITKPEPAIPELKQLAVAMNYAVVRIKSMFEEEAVRLEEIRRNANYDVLTGLFNRAYFMGRLHAALKTDESSSGGTLLLLRIADLAEKNKLLGREATDNLLKTVARLINQCAADMPGGIAGRLNGADFGLILPQGDHDQIIEQLFSSLVQESSAYVSSGPVVYIGTAHFDFGMDFAGLLTCVDGALAGVEAERINGVRVASYHGPKEAPRSSEQWAELIRRALQQDWVKLASYPVMNFADRLIHNERPLRLMFGGEWLPAIRFLPVAERTGLTTSLDHAAVALALKELTRDGNIPSMAINLSARSIQDSAFRQKLYGLLNTYPTAKNRLWLEVNEHGALAHYESFRTFCAEIKAHGCKLGLEHYGREFSQIGRLHDLGLDYLKVDASFVRDININAGNQGFLRGLAAIAHNIGLQVYAEGVTTKLELSTLEGLGFDGATGPGIIDPARPVEGALAELLPQ